MVIPKKLIRNRVSFFLFYIPLRFIFNPMFEQAFKETLAVYTADELLIADYWEEIQVAYSHKERHYHNPGHLENLFLQLLPVKHFIRDWHTILFSIAYHDIVYDTMRQDNEEKSAGLAENRLAKIMVPAAMIAHCQQQILATKGHTISENTDTNYFTDADLSILGAEPSVYMNYADAIKNEYHHYPDLMYRTGRQKILRYFLAMERIFKTSHFFNLYEKQARTNLAHELEIISKE